MTDRETLLQGFERQTARLDRRIERLREQSRRYSWGRLAILLAGIAVDFVAFRFGGEMAGWITAGIIVAIFIAVARLHRNLEMGIARAILWRDIKGSHIARMRLDWEHIPEASQQEGDPDHPFESDLDLTGHRSLHRLLDTAVTREGSNRLRSWLLDPQPDPEESLRRQHLVRELAPLTPFRDRLALLTRLSSKKAHEQWEAGEIVEWLREAPSATSLRTAMIVASILAAITIPLLIICLINNLPAWWGIPFGAYALILISRRHITKETMEDALTMELALSKFGAAFRHLENYNYRNNNHLKSLCSPFLDAENRPSRHLQRISRVASGATFQSNPLLWVLVNSIIPLNLYLAYRLATLRHTVGELLPVWLDRWFELETLNSLATYAYLTPETSFPELIPEGEGDAIFDAVGLGHPLIAAERKSRNDFAIGTAGEITLITGSNMAGKSTFLRTLGINLRLAFAGAPVDAASLRTVPFRIFTSIRINDSLSDGFSFFYAEVRRLRMLLDELERPAPFPLLFLVDEIFRGTNNRERLIGSSAYIRALAGHHGAGAIATHDLELVHLADEIPSITNRHFREEVLDGKMVFDYKLRSGPCPTTNALRIMRIAGLPVDIPEEPA
ncbi:MAG: hypothetical protein ABI876_05150 [Bacteroidota bacterium]